MGAAERGLETEKDLDLTLDSLEALLFQDPQGVRDQIGKALELFRGVTALGTVGVFAPAVHRAFRLEASARRLLKDSWGSDSVYAKVARLSVNLSDRGSLLRGLALLRWDQGRWDEALGLLSQASLLYERAKRFQEAGECLALVGLLSLEEDEFEAASDAFEELWRFRTAPRDDLAAAALLGEALCWAERGEAARARRKHRRAIALFDALRGEGLLFALRWREGQICAALGDLELAEEFLDEVRRRSLQRHWVVEASLITLEQALVRGRRRRSGAIPALEVELQTTFGDSPGLEVANEALIRLQEDLKENGRASDLWVFGPPAMRLSFRARGIPPQPVPFV